jgi:hypothetical protein
MDERAQLVLRLLRVLVLAFALLVAIEMLDLRGPDPDVPPHVLLDERLHSEEPPMTRRWRCIVIVMLCCRLASVSSTPPGTASCSRSGRR